MRVLKALVSMLMSIGKPGISTLKNTETQSSATDVTLTWSAAAENGGEILFYTMWIREINDNGTFGKWVNQNTSNDAVTYTITGLAWCKTYQFGVTAWNRNGESALDLNSLKEMKVVPGK